MVLKSVVQPPLMQRRPAVGFRYACAFLLMLTGCSGPVRPELEAEGGRLALSMEQLAGLTELQGEWLARRGEPGADSLAAFTAYGYPDRHWRPVSVPGYFRDQGFPAEGLVWYRLHLHLPAGAPPLKAYLRHADNAHAIYVARPGEAGQEMASSGWPFQGEGAGGAGGIRLSRAPIAFNLPPDTSLVVTWAVANERYLNGGPFFAIAVGSAEEMDEWLLREAATTFVLFCLYALVAAFFLLYWSVHRRDWKAFAIGLISFAMAARTMAVSGNLEILFPESFGFGMRIALEASSFLSLNGLLAFLLMASFPLEFAELRRGAFRLPPPEEGSEHPASPRLLPLGLRRANTLIVGGVLLFSAVAVPAAMMGPPLWASYAMLPGRWVSFGLVLPAVGIVAAAMWLRRPMAWGMGVGMALVMVGGLHDVLLVDGVLTGRSYVAGYAFLGFVLIQGYAMIRRNAHNAIQVGRSATALREQVDSRTKELRAATIAAQAGNLAKGQFLSAVSHELRTPLASILGYTEILREELDGAVSEQHREFLDTIHASAHRLLLMVNDLLDTAKIEAGRLSLRAEPVDLRPMLRDVVDQAQPHAREKGLRLETFIDEAEPVVMADWIRLRQVLLNLLSNAVKFTETGGVTLRVRPAALDGREAVAIAVADTGPGVSEEFLPQLFERFAQEPRVYEKAQRGAGLGLSIAREFVHRMGGQILVETRQDEGATFTVLLPRAPVQKERTGEYAYRGAKGEAA